MLAVAAPWIAPYGPLEPVTDAPPLSHASPQHPFGVNLLGRDIYSQVIWGSQVSLIVGVMSAFVAIVIGTGVGLISGYVGGWLDEVIMRFNDVVLSIPFLVLMIVVAARIGNLDLWGIIFVIGFTGWSVTARVVRGQVLSLKERMFVERGKMIGSSNWHIVIRHILPNAFPVVFANGILTIAISILSESDRRKTLIALEAITDYESWGRMRELHGLSFEEACEVWVHAIDRLLPPTPAN